MKLTRQQTEQQYEKVCARLDELEARIDTLTFQEVCELSALDEIAYELVYKLTTMRDDE